MTPTEIKAKELVNKFNSKLFEQKNGSIIINEEKAIQCAIICQEREVFSLNKMYRWIDENHLRDFRLKLQFEQEVLTHLKEM